MDARSAFNFTPPTLLFETSAALTGQPPSYDVSADGRFLMIKDTSGRSDDGVEPIVVNVNWFDELKRRVPVQ